LANSILTGLGRFFLQFGLASFILSLLITSTLSGFGLPAHPVIASMAKLLPAVGLTSMVLGIFGFAAGKILYTFFPQVGQLAGISAYLSIFLPVVSGIATVVVSLITLVPLPGGVSAGLATALSALATASVAYYLAVRLGFLPAE